MICNNSATAMTPKMPCASLGRTTVTFASILLLAGCAGGVSQQSAANYDLMLAHGNYGDAAKLAIADGQIQPDGASKNLAWSLGAGAALLASGDATTSVKVFDAGAEDWMKLRDTGQLSQYTVRLRHLRWHYDQCLQGFGLSRHQRQRERQGWNSITVGDRQSRAEEKFARDKEKLDAAAQQKASGQFDLAGAVRNAQGTTEFKAANAELAKFANYRPFINPAASYLSGIYWLSVARTGSDYEKARVELQRVHDMLGTSSNPSVEADLAWAKSGKTSPGAKIWIVFENGQAPTFAEYRITFPVPVIAKGGVSAEHRHRCDAAHGVPSACRWRTDYHRGRHRDPYCPSW